ncbi:hypothetical protein C8A03DRAFT_35698 [Achaetomium macrosporum]|uniref:Inosine/uridine-preferring nucleoside hydrolase domain-containing protein n=1 Tax=Achaetomium macrosporum TaxID=79813 RepID=A0AAN7C6N9_9PEZI|nr:hypothetical protein C8A03DRAFT_35698 [Achaetomium macrosporum]
MSSNSANTSGRSSRTNSLPVRQGQATSNSNPRASASSQSASTARPPAHMGSAPSTERKRQTGAMANARSNTAPSSTARSTSPSIPFKETDWQYGYYKKLAKLVAERNPAAKPRILVITDIEQDYDDLLAIIFLAEMHRMGAVKLAGCIANHAPANRRAKFLRTVLHLLGLPDIPVAVGTQGAEDLGKHAHDHFYGLKNETFEKAPWNEEPFLRGSDLIEKLVRPGKPLTPLLISSLQDIGEFFDRHKKDAQFLKQNFSKFVSQGGYEIGQDSKTGKLALTPRMDMANNQFHPTQAANYCNCLVAFNLPSDAWSREAAKAARIPGTFMQQLFNYGPIGAHLRWLWQRQEFKFFWDPLNWPFMPQLDVGWYLNTRLGLARDSPEFRRLKQSDLNFEMVAPLVQVIAYDCCAAVGAVGDDFMREMGVLGNLPDYNLASHKHRVFGRQPTDMGGINTANLSKVMEVFLLGGLLSTYRAAKETPGFQQLKHNPKASPYDASHFLKNVLPLMKKMNEHKDKAKNLRKDIDNTRDAAEIKKLTELARKEEAEAVKAENSLRAAVGPNVKKLPTRDDLPYEQLYQEAMKRVSASQASAGKGQGSRRG